MGRGSGNQESGIDAATIQNACGNINIGGPGGGSSDGPISRLRAKFAALSTPAKGAVVLLLLLVVFGIIYGALRVIRGAKAVPI